MVRDVVNAWIAGIGILCFGSWACVRRREQSWRRGRGDMYIEVEVMD